MPVVTIRVFKGTPPTAHSLSKVLKELVESFPDSSTLNDSSAGIDYELHWTEEKTINNVVLDSEVKSIQVNLEKVGYLSVRKGGLFWFISGLGRRAKILSSRAVAPFSLKPFKPEMVESVQSKALRNQTFTNIRVSDLAIENIPSLKAEIPVCSGKNLLSLVAGTEARVTSLQVESLGSSIGVSINGTVKAQADDFNWVEIINDIMPVIEILKIKD